MTGIRKTSQFRRGRSIGGVNRERRVMFHAVRVEHADLEKWFKKHLRSTDHVVIESTTVREGILRNTFAGNFPY
jgi:hypothetical protein